MQAILNVIIEIVPSAMEGSKEKGEVLVIVGNFYYIIYDTISFLSSTNLPRKALESSWVRRQRWKHFLSHEELLTQMIFNGIFR